MKKITREKQILYLFLLMIFVGEVIFMIFSPEKTFFISLGMTAWCFVDALTSILKKKDGIWFEVMLFLGYLILSAINFVILL